MMRTLSGMLSAVAVMAVAPAAAGQALSPEQAVAYLDAGRDGRTDVDDYIAFQKPKLAQFDADANGALSAEEFAASLPERERSGGSQAFPTFDFSKDGGLDLPEFLAYHAYVFRTYIDTDRDGAMSPAEFAAATGAAPAPATAPAQAQAAANPLRMLDYNQDGRTELNEYLNFQLPNLAKNDRNGNGRLSRDEFRDTLPENRRGSAEASFRTFDRDKDKGLEQEEFLGYHAWVFKNVLDGNRDGFVDQAEWAKVQGGG